ncbi:phospholipid-transporting ATPase ABCA7 [Delphinus delphis]|uniref:phospholipid-transporting ATPase ABCA7 n=1 Tax=Delphinus delphis TaxID=9728 RepID=UPI003750ACC1
MVHPSALGSTRAELVGALDAHPLSHRLWRRLKPLVLGKVNQTFQGLALLKGIQEVWELLGAPLLNFANDSAGVARLQRLLQVTGRRQPGAGGQDRGEALRAFLNPRSGGCSWNEAHADMGHLVGTLGRDGGPEEDPGTSDPRPSPSQCVTLDELEAAPSEAALVERALELLSEPEDFPDSSQSPGPGHVRIKIRMDIDDVTRANKIRDRFWDPGAAADALVWGSFVYLQDLLERAALRVLTGAAPRAGLYLQQMPYTCYVDDAFLRVLSRSLPLFLMLAWIYSVALTAKAVVREKETRLCCTMCAMGLSGAVLWLGWFLSCLGPFLLSTALLVLVLKVGAPRPSRLQNGCAFGDILPYSHAVVPFPFLAAFKVATVVQSFFLSACFSRANLAAACGGLAYFVLYLPYVLCVAWRDQLPVGGRVAASFLLPVAFGFGCESLALLEEQGEGAQWHNVGTGPIADVFSLAQVSGLLLLDAALYGLATWYLEAVCPGESGIPEPWNVPFGGATGLGLRPPSAQPPAPQDPKGVSIRSLEKRFPGNPQPALHGLSLDFYQGLITAFLGHNGAGKTTTLSILTGLFPPTAGSACVLGHDVRSNMAAIRPHLGVCPRYSVLFDMLTVDEHVWFYGRLKSLSAAAVGPEQDRLMQDVGLVPKRHALTRHLSGEEPLGGIQWKLSVAIAFVGGSQVVILDEPTAGVDPASRRGIRELLLKYQDDRTLILSTHHLDEAELLGDRVAVVAGGRLCCCGSPLFLWCHLVSRYYLTLVKCPPALATSKKGDTDLKDNMDPGQEGEPGSQASTAGEGRGGRAKSHVPGARLVKELPHELVLALALPYQGAPDSSFAELFCELDQRLGKLGLAGFGISDTSLEEVWLLGEIFLKVVEDCAVDTGPGGAAADGRPRQHPCSGIAHLDATARLQILLEESALENGGLAGSAPETQALQSSGPDAAGCVHGWVLAHQQLRALLLRRFLLACCSRCGLFAQIVLPALFVGLALVFSLIMPPFGYYPALQLSPSMYGSQVSFFSWSITPLTYPPSSFFSMPSMAYMVLTCINLFVGINGSMATFVLELFSDQKLQEVSWILKWVFLIFPRFCLGWALIDMVRNQAMADAFERLGENFPPGGEVPDESQFYRCFGLLGVNGAGKTSTFHMVTGDTVPSGGEVVLAGHSVAREPAVAYCRMGYCPQLDAIFELLTGREHLELFTASSGLGRLGLPQCADSPVGTYSRGNKRKLATAVALVGDPAVVSLVSWGREALCTHLAIMVNGRFRCLVSTQHLQGRFGAGHTLTLRVSESQSESVAAFVAATFPGAELREVRGGRLRFQLPPGARCALGHLFGELAARGAEHGVEDFSVSQTTLEEDQGKEEDEKDAEVGADPVPGPQNPRLITQFLEDHSMAGTVL